MSKRTTKAAAPPPPTAPAPTPAPVKEAQRPRRMTGPMGPMPWEEYSDSASVQEGLNAMIEDGQTEVLVSAIEDVANGRIRISSPKMPMRGDADVREKADGMLKWKTKDGKLVDLKETDHLASGSEEGGRVVFAADAFYYILLTDDMKYRAMQNAYKMYREDPLFRGLINSLLNFIIGKGLKFQAMDENPAVNEYIKQFWAINKMVGKDSEIIKRHLLTGEIALWLMPKGTNKLAAKYPAVRLIPFWRLAEVLKDPEDAEVITGFRVWRASGPYRPQVNEDIVSPDEMMFWKNSTPEEDRGEPPLLACMKPAKWYADWMQNRVTLNRFRTAIVLFKKIIKGTPGKVSAISSADPSATLHQGTHGKLEKRLPKAGTVVTHNDSIEYDFKSPQLGAADAGEDGRKILLYVACAAQVPEFLLGDAGTVQFSNLFVAENPFIRQIEAYQTYFEGFFEELFRRVIQHGIDTGEIPKTSTETTVTESSAVGRLFRRLIKKAGLAEALNVDSDDDGNTTVQKSIPTRTDVKIDWPSLLHNNQLEDAQVMQLHQALGIASKQTLAGKAGYDWDVEKERLKEEQADDQDAMVAQRQAMIDAAADAGGPGNDPSEPGGGVPKEKGDKGTKTTNASAAAGSGDPSRTGYGKS